MSDRNRAVSSAAGKKPDPDDLSVSGLVDLVTAYAKQETIGPLRNAGRFLGFGIAGASALAVGVALVLLGLLRLIQTEWPRAASGSLSWLAYLIVLVACIAGIVVALSRISKGTLNHDPVDPNPSASSKEHS